MTKKSYNIGNQNAAKADSKTTKIEIRCTTDEKKAWSEAAESNNKSTATWVRNMLNDATKNPRQ